MVLLCYLAALLLRGSIDDTHNRNLLHLVVNVSIYIDLFITIESDMQQKPLLFSHCVQVPKTMKTTGLCAHFALSCHEELLFRGSYGPQNGTVAGSLLFVCSARAGEKESPSALWCLRPVIKTMPFYEQRRSHI